jgi:hypothetical protein
MRCCIVLDIADIARGIFYIFRDEMLRRIFGALIMFYPPNHSAFHLARRDAGDIASRSDR